MTQAWALLSEAPASLLARATGDGGVLVTLHAELLAQLPPADAEEGAQPAAGGARSIAELSALSALASRAKVLDAFLDACSFGALARLAEREVDKLATDAAQKVGALRLYLASGNFEKLGEAVRSLRAEHAEEAASEEMAARPSPIPFPCAQLTRAGIEWRRCHRAACMARSYQEHHRSVRAGL